MNKDTSFHGEINISLGIPLYQSLIGVLLTTNYLPESLSISLPLFKHLCPIAFGMVTYESRIFNPLT
jgi:hypothetical protein